MSPRVWWNQFIKKARTVDGLDGGLREHGLGRHDAEIPQVVVAHIGHLDGLSVVCLYFVFC
jgi:hypothetical protein